MFVVGLTGGIGSGKTTVAQLFSELDVEIIDTDEIAHDIVQTGQPALKELSDAFEENILNEDGSLNRGLLRNIIFQDTKKRETVEHILHPLIRSKLMGQIKETREENSARYIMLVIPLLVDNGDWMMIDRILVVDCEDETQVARVMDRDKQTRQQVIAVMDAQIDREERLLAADDIIDNNSEPELLEEAVLNLHREYLKIADSYEAMEA